MTTTRRLRALLATAALAAAAAPAAAQADTLTLEPRHVDHQLVIEKAEQVGDCSAPVHVTARLTKTGLRSLAVPVTGVSIRFTLFDDGLTKDVASTSKPTDGQGRVSVVVQPPLDCMWQGRPYGQLEAGAQVDWSYDMAWYDRSTYVTVKTVYPR